MKNGLMKILNFNFIQKWLNNILELDFYKVIMKKYKPWTELSLQKFLLVI